MAFPSLATSRLQVVSIAIAGTWACCFFVVGWIAAGWYWQALSPVAVSPAPSPASDPLAASRAVASRHLMGEVQPREAAASGTAAAPTGLPKFRLLGAMTSSAQNTGFAVLAEEGKRAISVLEGEEVVPGVTLQAVRPESVVLTQGARSVEIPLAYGPSAAPSAGVGATRAGERR